MAIKKGLLKKQSTAPDGVYPYTSTDCVFDENSNSLDSILENIEFEYGKQGNFTYRKWKNGVLEVWGYNSSDMTVAPTQWGGVYGLDIPSLGTYPIPFRTIECVLGNVSIRGLNGWSGVNYADSELTYAPAYIWERGNSASSASRNVRRSLYVKGTWK